MKTSAQKPELFRSSHLYFQIGLVISLFLTYYFIELEVPQNQEGVVKDEIRELPREVYHKKLVVIKEVTPEKEQIKKKSSTNFSQVKDDTPEKEPEKEPETNDTPESDTPEPQTATTPTQGPANPLPIENRTFNTWELDENPSFAACVGLKGEAAKKCFNEELQKFLKRNMKYPERAIANGNEGTVMVTFVIDKQGRVSAIHPTHKKGKISKELEQEAVRLVGLLPKLSPGKQGAKPVDVSFTLPISFKIL